MMPPALLVILLLAGLLGLALLLRRLLGRPWLYRTIFEAETPAGKAFDVVLLVAILLSVLEVILESEPQLRLDLAAPFQATEWAFTLLFTLEYLLRLLCVPRPLRYARSFFGVVDLLSIAPAFLGLLLSGTKVFLVVRVLRLLRVFRVLKMGAYLQASEVLWRSIVAGRRKIGVFLLTILTLVIIIGALMYVIEGPERGFRSIPVGIYWAIVTITTVGYGDVAPVTPLGRLIASAVMLLGYSIIAVPTGIVTAEIGGAMGQRRREADRSSQRATVGSHRQCGACHREGHEADARHCKHCGAPL